MYPSSKQYWLNIGPILGRLANIGKNFQYCAYIGAILTNMANIVSILGHLYCANIGNAILCQY